MPSTYAHYKFGKEVLELIPDEEKKRVEKNKNLYGIGLHGPDILFYYKPLSKNAVNTIGYELHEKEAVYFFRGALEKIKKAEDREAAAAYIYGFICHYALDCECHAYIDEKIEQSGISHAEIEVEFDRMLMVQDGLNPITHNLTTHIEVKEEDCNVISGFFEQTTPEDIRDSLKSMKMYHNILLAKSEIKRNLLYAVLKMTGNYDQMKGMIVNKNPNPHCADSNEKLSRKYSIAQALAVSLIMEFSKALEQDKKELGKGFEKTFSGKEKER